MRVLFTTSPGPGVSHTFPTVPLAWAFRSFGHEVMVATGRYRGYESQLTATGLPILDAAPTVDFADVPGQIIEKFPHLAERSNQMFATEYAIRMFAEFGSALAGGVMAVAEQWRPDLVVYTALDGVGPLIASKLGIPSVLHEVSLFSPRGLTGAVYDFMAEDYGRYGVSPAKPAFAISVTPPSMRVYDTNTVAMRCVPYNGGGILPGWLLEPTSVPRIVVTVGMTLPQSPEGGESFRQLLSAANEEDAEFVILLGGLDADQLGPLPANVRTTQWVPLHALLSSSDAIIHHGGGGTVLTSLSAGVLQAVVPYSVDHRLNAAAVEKRRLGICMDGGTFNAEALHGLLVDASARVAAREVAEEIRALPLAVDLVPKLVGLTQ